MAFETSKNRKTVVVILSVLLALAVLGAGGYVLVTGVVVPRQNYQAAQALYDGGSYAEAEAAFAELGDYQDAAARVADCRDARAMAWVDAGDYAALSAHMDRYGLSDEVCGHICATALDAIEQGDYDAACAFITALEAAPEVRDTIRETLYLKSVDHYDLGEYAVSDALFTFLGDYKDSAQKIHVHDYILTAELAPGCEAEGALEYRCHCGAAETEPIAATGHDYGEATCTKPATCSLCGSTTGSTLAHAYSAATCTKGQVCTVCGGAGGGALGHSLVNCVCSRCGKVEITLDQLQGTWVHSAGYTTIVISGDRAKVYWHLGGIEYTGTVKLKHYGFSIDGTYDSENIYGEPFTANIREICYISKFTPTYFVDTYDDQGPYTWYKQ